MVLSVRDPDKWFASTQNTVLNEAVVGFHDARGSRAMVEAVGWGSDPRLHDRAFMLDRFERHTEAVKQAIPPERLQSVDLNSPELIDVEAMARDGDEITPSPPPARRRRRSATN